MTAPAPAPAPATRSTAQPLESRRLMSATPITLAEFTFDGRRFFAPYVDRLGNTTLAQSGADVVAGGQAGDSTAHAAAWNKGVNDGANLLSLHLKPAKVKGLALLLDYRSTAPSKTAVSFGPPSITIKVSIDKGKTFLVKTFSLTRDSSWHALNVDLSKVTGLSAAAGATIQILPANGADVGTLSIDDVRIRGSV
jgi:hypothetical protein